MKFDLRDWEQKKKLIEKEKAERQKDLTKYEMLSERLQAEFGCTVEEATKKRDELTRKLAKIEEQLDAVAEELEAYEW
jgi:hypothetical protein